MAAIKLLLIEDDEDDYIITRDLLAEIGRHRFQLDWYADVNEARAALARNSHDVCLLDYSLGTTDGLSLLREAALLGFRGPIIMFTGQDSDALDAEALSAGAVDYLIKSQLSAARLARAIRYAIARRDTEIARLKRHQAEMENRAKSEFLAHLSHELRTPLTAILGYADVLIQKPDETRLLEYLHIIKNNGTHLLGLLNDILDLSKIEAGKLEIERKVFDLHSLLSDLYHLMLVKARAKQLQLQFDCGDGLPRQITQDPVRLRQILLNLLSNAIKFTDSGSVVLRAAYSHHDGRHWLQFDITDSGIGISASDFGRIFQEFSQSEQAVSRPDKGSGLGLAICQRLATLLEGFITLESELGRGTTFSLKIPFAIEQTLEISRFNLLPQTATDADRPKIQLQGRILVVDDIEEIRLLVGHIIGSTGLSVTYAEDGNQALRVILREAGQNRQFDLAIIDLQMPGLSGINLLQKLRQQSVALPAIALTALAMKGQREECLRAGFIEHLVKPIDATTLIQTVQRHLPKSNDAAHCEQQCATSQQQVRKVLSPVLLIEDNADARQSTRLLLQMLNCEVDSAANARETFDYLRTHQPPALIISDLQLPDMSGEELSRQLRDQLGNAVRLVALSGKTLQGNESNQHAFDAVFLKPVTQEILKIIITKPETTSEHAGQPGDPPGASDAHQ